MPLSSLRGAAALLCFALPLQVLLVEWAAAAAAQWLRAARLNSLGRSRAHAVSRLQCRAQSPGLTRPDPAAGVCRVSSYRYWYRLSWVGCFAGGSVVCCPSHSFVVFVSRDGGDSSDQCSCSLRPRALGTWESGLMLIHFVVCFRWYFGKIKRIEAEKKLLLPENDHGAFLIRDSESRRNDYSLSGGMSAIRWSISNDLWLAHD